MELSAVDLALKACNCRASGVKLIIGVEVKGYGRSDNYESTEGQYLY